MNKRLTNEAQRSTSTDTASATAVSSQTSLTYLSQSLLLAFFYHLNFDFSDIHSDMFH